jgi:phosphoribosylanthranilate isomerase
MFVKICGITRRQDAEAAVAAGAGALGFVFWPGSPRFIDAEGARQIVSSLPAFVTPVGVFVNQSIEHVTGVAHLVRLGAVQLHGDEDPSYAAGVPCPVIKAVPVGAAPGAAHRLEQWPDRVTLLVDAHDPVRRGGTGRIVDWSAAAAIARQRRCLLAGGLTPENVAEAIAAVRPFGIDVSSGVESSPGVKDHTRLEALFTVVRASLTPEPESLRSRARSSARGGGAPRAMRKG